MSILKKYINGEYTQVISQEELTLIQDMLTLRRYFLRNPALESESSIVTAKLTEFNNKHQTNYVSLEGVFGDLGKKLVKIKDKFMDFLSGGFQKLLGNSFGTAERLSNRFEKYDDENIKAFNNAIGKIKHDFAGEAKPNSVDTMVSQIVKHFEMLEKQIETAHAKYKKYAKDIDIKDHDALSKAHDDIFSGFSKVRFEMMGVKWYLEDGVAGNTVHDVGPEKPCKFTFDGIKEYVNHVVEDTERLDKRGEFSTTLNNVYKTCADFINDAYDGKLGAFSALVATRGYDIITHIISVYHYIGEYFRYVIFTADKAHDEAY